MIDNIANRNRPTFWSGWSWLIVNFQFREEFLRGFNCFCVSHSHVYLHEKQQLVGRRSPSLLSHKAIGISFLFIYLSFSFKQIDSLLGSEWECWHTFHPVCCLLPLISLTPGFLFQYQSENKFKFVSEWSKVVNDFYFRRWFCRILIIGIGRFERNANEINGARSRLSIF